MDETPKELLADVRRDIDAIDQALLPLFIERMKISERVAEIKNRAGLPVLNQQREDEILERVREQGGDYGASAADLYASIMAISRQRQQEMLEGTGFQELLGIAGDRLPTEGAAVLCQGVEGAYSHQAAKNIFPGGKITFYPRFDAVFEALEKGEGEFGVIPVENSAAGSVAEAYGLILKYRYYIVSALSLTVNHCLAARVGTVVKKVVSHPQALQQCGGFLRAHDLQREEFSNTAVAASFVAESGEPGLAAICSRQAAEKYGLEILAEGIQDDKNNHTRFAVVSKKPYLCKGADKISLCFTLPNITGSLYRVLERFALSGLNLTKIESRPIKGSNFDYDFYLDFQGNLREMGVKSLLSALQEELPRFSFLGNYSEFIK